MYKMWEVADACEEDPSDPCWTEIRNEKAAYECLQGNQVCLSVGRAVVPFYAIFRAVLAMLAAVMPGASM